MAKTRFKIIPEVHLVLRSGEKILMLRRYQTGYMDGFYSLVAGHVEGSETFREAMVREAAEEAGISIDLNNLFLVHIMHRLEKEERLSIFFEARAWSGKIVNMEPGKCDDLGWYAIPDKAKQLVPYVAAALENLSAGDGYSEFGWT